nr:unnamed protein product [Callosobruchus analis]
MSWSREQVQALIEQYRQNPCLYAVRSAAYKNRHARQAALESVHVNIAALRRLSRWLRLKQNFRDCEPLSRRSTRNTRAV